MYYETLILCLLFGLYYVNIYYIPVLFSCINIIFNLVYFLFLIGNNYFVHILAPKIKSQFHPPK